MKEMNDVAKEVISILNYFDDDLIKKIPIKFLDYLNDLGVNSNSKVYVNVEKELEEQNISEESKDLIALIYYSYIADEEEKKQILKLWTENEKIYQKQLEEKYNLNNIFENKIENKKEIINLPTEIQKGNLLIKIINFIKKLLKKL